MNDNVKAGLTLSGTAALGYVGGKAVEYGVKKLISVYKDHKEKKAETEEKPEEEK